MLPLLQGIFGPGQKPWIVGIRANTGTATPFRIYIPNEFCSAGTLNVALIARHAGGTAAPGNPTEFTSLTSSTTAPAYRLAYRFASAVGSILPPDYVVSTSATSATSFTGICVGLRGANASAVPQQGGVATATSTTPNPGSFSPTNVAGRPVLWIAYAMWNGSATVTDWPVGYAIGRTEISEGANGGMAIAMKYGTGPTEDPGAFTISASLVNRAGVISVPAF